MAIATQRPTCSANECEGTRRPTDTYCAPCKTRAVQPWTCPVCATGHHFPTGAMVRRCYYCGNTFDRRP